MAASVATGRGLALGRGLLQREVAAAAGLQRATFRLPVRHMSLKPGALVRSTTTGLRATVFGAYGFVGRYVTALLAAGGTQCIIPYRGDDMEWRHLKVGVGWRGDRPLLWRSG